MKPLFLIIMSCICFCCSYAQQDSITKIILLRHAEKIAGHSPDPPLSASGKVRAEKLSKLLKDVKIDALYATPYKRTQGTLSFLSSAHGLPIHNYNPADGNDIASIIESAKGKCIVIAGHSNTIPALVNRLTGETEYPPMDEQDYGSVWILIRLNDRVIDCSRYHY